MTNKTNKSLPIIIDRLAHALEAQGFKAKRSQVLEIASSALGYRNSNELTAAAKAGDISPPEAEPVGLVVLPDGARIAVLVDTLAGAPYAIDEAFLEQVAVEERREQIGVTPYGHLASLARALEVNQPDFVQKITGGEAVSHVYVGWISHKHGHNFYVAIDEDGLYMQLAEYVRENWHEVEDHADEGENPDAMTDTEVVRAYFELCEAHEIGEYLETSQEEVLGRIVPTTRENPPTPDRYGMQVEMDDEPIYIVDNHRSDGDGDKLTVAEMPRSDDPIGDIQLARRMVDLLNGSSVPLVPAGHIPARDLVSLADQLEEGAAGDFWYDAHEHMVEDDPEDEDTIAHNAICTTQEAMGRAATILRAIASKATKKDDKCVRCASPIGKDGYCGDETCPFSDVLQSSPKGWEGHPDPLPISRESIDDTVKRQKREPVWITDESGYDTGNVSASHMSMMGIDFHKDRDSTLPLTENEYAHLLGNERLNKASSCPVQCGFSVLYRDQKWLAPEIVFDFDGSRDDERQAALGRARAYMDEKREIIGKIGGHLILNVDATDEQHDLAILIPFDLAFESEIDDWEAALSWLLLPDAERTGKRVICDFLPQTWIRDVAFAVDPNGDTAWDATFDALRWGRTMAKQILDSDADTYASDGTTQPDWVRDWTRTNPFEVMVDGLEELFGIDED